MADPWVQIVGELGSQAKSWRIMYGVLGLDPGVNCYLYGAFKHGNCIIKFLFWNYISGCLCRKWIGGSECAGREDNQEAPDIVREREGDVQPWNHQWSQNGEEGTDGKVFSVSK